MTLPTLDNSSQVNSNIKISSIEIFSTLTDSTFIGIAPSEVPNTKNILSVPNGVQKWLQLFVDKEYRPIFNVSGNKLIWSIDALRVGVDSASGSKVSFVKLGAEVLRSIENDSYQRLGRFDTIVISRDSATNLGKGMATALNSLYLNSIELTGAAEIGHLGNLSRSLRIAEKDIPYATPQCLDRKFGFIIGFVKITAIHFDLAFSMENF